MFREIGPQSKRGPYERIFTPVSTLWCLIFQRLNFDKSLSAVVLDVSAGGIDALATKGKALSEKILSIATTSYSDARQRLPESHVQAAYRHSVKQSELSRPFGSLRRVQIIDGTLLPMLANSQLVKEYPPASNQYGTSCWCQMRVVAAFDCNLNSALAATQAPILISEQTMTWDIFEQSPDGTLSIGDRNFGVYSVVAAARHHNQHVLLRMTAVRAKKLAGSSGWLSGRQEVVSWSPTRSDKVHPEIKSSSVEGRLIYVRVERLGFRPVDLWLFTTLMDDKEFSIEVLMALYKLRWNAEIDFRYLKTQLELSELTGRSGPMVRKEFYAAMITYNLILQTMQECAATLNLPVSKISFQAVRRALEQGVMLWLILGSTRLRRLRGLLISNRTKPKPNEPRLIRERPRIYQKLRGDRAQARATANSLAMKS